MKIKECPYCSGKKGFRVTVFLGGTEEKEVSFSGKVLSTERDGTDDVEKWAECLTCGKQLSIDNLNTQNV